jgi:hypothetical protein
MIVTILLLSAICVILMFLYLITIHYILAIKISEGIDTAKTDVILIPFEPNKKYD